MVLNNRLVGVENVLTFIELNGFNEMNYFVLSDLIISNISENYLIKGLLLDGMHWQI